MDKNFLKKLRESILMSKSELARKAGVSQLTIDRIEKGMPCRMATATKELRALVEDGFAEQIGRGRSVRYVYRGGNR